MTDSIEASIPIPTRHRLFWVEVDEDGQPLTAGGHKVEADDESLRKARYRSDSWMYDRLNAILSNLGFDEHDGQWDELRSFVQMVTHYDYMLQIEEERLALICWLEAVAAIHHEARYPASEDA